MPQGEVMQEIRNQEVLWKIHSYLPPSVHFKVIP